MPDVKSPLIIAHRGASADAPENSLAAFEKAIELGVDGLEFDVRLSKCGVPVVFHDPTLKRIAGVDGFVSDFVISELQSLDIGSWFNRKDPQESSQDFSAERIPTLTELLCRLEHFRGRIYIELKCSRSESAELVAAVCEIIRDSPLFPQIVLKCFRHRAIAMAKVELPVVRTAALFAPKILNVLNKKKHLLKKAEDCLADEISLHFSLATGKLARRAASAGFPLVIWTADNPLWISRAKRIGIDAIITNDPKRLLKTRDDHFARP